MPLSKFELMLKTDENFFFDTMEFENIIIHYLDSGQYQLAKKALNFGLNQHPDAINIKLLQTELLLIENRIDQAEIILNDLQNIEPYNDEIYIQKSDIFSKRNDHKQAIKTLKYALEFSNNLELLELIGMEYIYLENYPMARHYFMKCLLQNDEDYPSLYNILHCFEMENKHTEAISFLEAYIEKNPYNEIAWHQLGCQYYSLKEYEKALNAFDYAVLIDEKFIGGYIEKAKTLEVLGRYNEAVQNYLLTLNLDDPTAFTYTRIGYCSEQLRQEQVAIEYYNKATYEDPSFDKGWLHLIDFYYKKEDYNKALHYVKEALLVNDINITYWRKYASIQLKLNQYREATKTLYTCLSLGDDSIEVYTRLSDILVFLGEYNEALATLIKAKKKYPNNKDIEQLLKELEYYI